MNLACSEEYMPSVEQVKLKRAGTGLRACDRDRTCPAFTLFAPQSGGGKVYLIDLEGNVTHTWQMPVSPGNSGYLTERGTLFYNGKTLEDSKRFISERPWKGGAALEVDWNGRALWESDNPITITTAYGCVTATYSDLQLGCRRTRSEDQRRYAWHGHNGEMYADYLVEMTTAGQVVWGGGLGST